MDRPSESDRSRASWPRASLDTLRDELQRAQARPAFQRLEQQIMVLRPRRRPRRSGPTTDEIRGYDERSLLR